MKITVNPKYENLKDFIERVPQVFESEGRIVYKARNLIKVFEVDGISVNVKRYRKPILLNRIVYSFFRGTKASKAYYNALEVQKRGFLTPESIAYIEEYRSGLLSSSYYISLQSPFTKEIREYYWGPVQGNEDVYTQFAHYTAKLHEAGIYHVDYSPGNVLIGEKNGHYLFSLIDINRMKFASVDIEMGCHSFERMFNNDFVFELLATEYAKARGYDVNKCLELVFEYKDKFLLKVLKKRCRKKAIKKFFKRK